MFKIDHRVLDQRQKTKLHRRRIAAGVGDNARAPDTLAVDLGQAVNRFRHKLGARVLGAVPLFPRRDILDAEIGRDVDHAHAGIDQHPGLLHRDAVGRGEEYDVALLERGVRRRAESEINPAAQIGKHHRDRRARFLTRSNYLELAMRMLRQQAQQFDTGIAGAAHDSDFE
jgi:hypothetical protein